MIGSISSTRPLRRPERVAKPPQRARVTRAAEPKAAEPKAAPLSMAAAVLLAASRASVRSRSCSGLCHFGDAAGVVAMARQDGEAGGKGVDHAERRQGDAVNAEKGEGGEHNGGDDGDGENGQLVAEGKAVDDVGGGARLACVGHIRTGGVRGRGVVLARW